MSASRRKLSPVGRGWFRGLYEPEMEMPQAIVTAIVFYDRAPDQAVLVGVFEKHIWPLYRFSSIVIDDEFVPVGRPMDQEYHFAQRDVPDSAGLDEFFQSVKAAPLRRDQPLWQVTTLRASRGRSAVVIRVHHAISDGLGLLFAFLPTLSCEDGDVLSKIRLPAALLGKLAPNRTSSASPTSTPILRNKSAGGFCGGIFWKAFVAVRMFLRGVLSILLVKEDGEMAFNTLVRERKPFLKYSGRHVYTRMPAVPTSAIKAVGHAHGCTFNDAIMTALAGAFRRYAVETLKDPKVINGTDCECKAFMLVGLPRPIDPKDASVSLKNNILAPPLRLPIGEPNSRRRLQAVVAALNDLKSKAFLAGIAFTTRFITAIAPMKIMRKLASEAISKCTCNVSNLPLPDVPVHFAGQEVKEFQVIFVNNIPQITMLSYNGALHWNMVSDPQRFSKPEEFGRFFLEEFKMLAADADSTGGR